MKYFISAFIIVFISSNTFSQNINTPENFPDPNFRAAVAEFMGVEPGGEFTAAEAAIKDGTLDCSRRGIGKMTGIALFPALTELYCEGNQLTNLDVSKNTALTVLFCGINQLTSLDASNNPALTILACNANSLTSLDISNNPALENLVCSENQLTSLDVSKNPALVRILCQANQLTSLSSFVANEGLGQGDYVDVRNNFIGCVDPNAAMSDFQILTERLGKAVPLGFFGFIYEPQNECETAVSNWSLH